MGGNRGAYRILCRGLRERDYLEELVINGMIILK